MRRLILSIALLFKALIPVSAQAEPADIDAAARGVVRVVILAETPDGMQFLGHGTGFAVTSKRIVTNAHVVEQATKFNVVRIGIIPSEGDDPSFGKLVDYNASKDLALVEITEDLRLPTLTLVSNYRRDDNEVVAVGYPGVVDRALSSNIRDRVKAQPPVTSRGFVSGQRQVGSKDSILHSASIAGGNSGGPLLDECGRVLGVNSSSTVSAAGEAEFFFAISNKELLPFLRRNDIEVRVTDLPCRSLADLERDEAERQEAARELAAAEQEEMEAENDRLRERIEDDVQEDRENAMGIAAILLMIAAGSGVFAWQAQQKEAPGNRVYIFAGVAALAAVSAGLLWLTRPGADEVDKRFAEETQRGDGDEEPGETFANRPGKFACTLDLERSRIISDPERDIDFDWQSEGCVNDRTQYGRDGLRWSRVFVPEEEDAVSVNSFDPSRQEFRVERFLIGRNDMAEARDKRQSYDPPSCDAVDAAQRLGDMQGGVLEMLPDRPNERLVYRCEPR